MKAYNQEFQRNISPQEVLQILKDGNARFVANTSVERNLLEQAHQTALQGQFPIAVFLSCIDARTSIEHIFDLGIGDVFSVKVAGNVVNTDVLASLEYACKVAGSKVLIVKGHSKCGAVAAACKNVKLGNITSLIGKISSSVEAVKAENSTLSTESQDFKDRVGVQNVAASINEIRKGSPILNEMETKGEILILAAFHNLETGVVDFSIV